jgi:hypothetical protein
MRCQLATLLAGACLGALAALDLAPSPSAVFAAKVGDGAVRIETHTESHRFKDGNFRKADIRRAHLLVPKSYGKLVFATGGMLWYEDDKGRLRNVVADELALVEQIETQVGE